MAMLAASAASPIELAVAMNDARRPTSITADHVLAEHWAMIGRIARAHERDDDARRDLVQDIALAVVRALPGFRGETDLRVFVARVAEHRCIDHIARAVRRHGDVAIDTDLPSPARGPDQHADLGQRVDRLAQALQRLPLGLREAAVLALEGFEPREVGAVLGLTANTAAQRMKRARDALRTTLGEEPSP